MNKDIQNAFALGMSLHGIIPAGPPPGTDFTSTYELLTAKPPEENPELRMFNIASSIIGGQNK